MNRINSKFCQVLIFCFFISVLVSGQKLKISANVGWIHNTIFVNPKLQVDTIVTIFGVSGRKSFPSEGFLLGSEIERKFPNSKFSFKAGIDYSHYVLISKVDSGTAKYLQRYFANPSIESRLIVNCASIPAFITYTYRGFSLDLGLSLRILTWAGEKSFLLDGEKVEVKPLLSSHGNISSSFISRLNVEVAKLLSCSIGYSPKYGPMADEAMVYFGVKYTFKKVN